MQKSRKTAGADAEPRRPRGVCWGFNSGGRATRARSAAVNSDVGDFCLGQLELSMYSPANSMPSRLDKHAEWPSNRGVPEFFYSGGCVISVARATSKHPRFNSDDVGFCSKLLASSI